MCTIDGTLIGQSCGNDGEDGFDRKLPAHSVDTGRRVGCICKTGDRPASSREGGRDDCEEPKVHEEIDLRPGIVDECGKILRNDTAKPRPRRDAVHSIDLIRIALEGPDRIPEPGW